MKEKIRKEDARLFRAETELATLIKPLRTGPGAAEIRYEDEKISWFSAKQQEVDAQELGGKKIEETLGPKKRDLETVTAVVDAKKEAGAKEIEALEELLRKRKAKVRR